MKTVIELLGWGDFDVQYTECIMIHPEALDINKIKSEFCEMHGIASFKGLPSGDLSSYLDSFKKFLSQHGFKQLKTTSVYFSD